MTKTYDIERPEDTFRAFCDRFHDLLNDPMLDRLAESSERLAYNYTPDGQTAHYVKRAIALRLLIESR